MQRKNRIEYWNKIKMGPIRSVQALLCSLVLPLFIQTTWATVSYEHDVRPILTAHCFACHGPDASSRKADLRLDRQLVNNTKNDPLLLIQPSSPETSQVYQRITHPDPAEIMPPPKSGTALTPDQIQIIRTWIQEGASWSEHWSFTPLSQPDIPTPTPEFIGKVRNAIDAFVFTKLDEKGLSPSPMADRRTLIRRLYFNLIGLPPSPREIEDFIHDTDPMAYEKLAGKLLDSPHYGERWARHWLDVVKYADTHGYDKDKPRPHAWPYRDYVIESFNQDKPYDQFVKEQIAADILFPEDPESIPALGFIAAGPWDFIGHAEVPESKMDGQIARNLDRDDMVSNVMNTFTSTTIQCARCHDHKFDPFTQEHYYNLQSVFASIDKADRTFDSTLDTAMKREAWTTELTRLENELSAMTPKTEGQGEETPAHANENAKTETPAQAEILQQISKIKAHLQSLPPPRKVYAGTVHQGEGAFRGRHGLGPREIRILNRGEISQPKQLAVPGTIPLIPGLASEFDLAEPEQEGLRRAALAHWLVHKENPLTWRSIVNRIWHYHFGQGIVSSPNDFGRMGEPPSHPELLDWLASDFRDNGQSFKKLHYLIVTSATFRQASADHAQGQQMDQNNKWLWRMNRSRLDAESMRDCILAVSGRLKTDMGGPGFNLFKIEHPDHSPHYQYHLHDPNDRASFRRSIYRFIVRSQPDPFMTSLDCADSSQSTPVRIETITPVQALNLLNDKFIGAMAEAFADRLIALDVTESQRLEQAFMLALSRHPDEAETQEWLNYVSRHGWANACRLIFNLNEFGYIN